MTHRQFTRAASALAVASLVALAARPVQAQSTAQASISALASVVGVAPLAATGVNDLNFGSVPAGSPTTPANVASQAGRFDITGQPTAPVIVSFNLPTVLTGAGGSIPILFGSSDGIEWGPFPSASVNFDPNIPYLTALDPQGNLTVGITGTVDPPAGTTTGSYTGTITLTVAY